MILVLDLVDDKATRALGAAIAELIEPADVVLLSGELGAGKTTLTKGLVEGLGGDDEVTSPTFTLCQLYATTPVVAHVDCWRLESAAELRDLALDEVLDSGGVAVIEWGERAAPRYGDDALLVVLADGTDRDDGTVGRRAVLETAGQKWGARARHLEAVCRSYGLSPAHVPDGDGSEGAAPR